MNAFQFSCLASIFFFALTLCSHTFPEGENACDHLRRRWKIDNGRRVYFGLKHEIHLDSQDKCELELIDWLLTLRNIEVHAPCALERYELYLKANQILFLNDGFNQTGWGVDDYSLSERFQELAPESAVILKTGIDCPNELDSNKSRNICFLRIDHQDPLPFEDNRFDIIIMRKGLCFCDAETISCGGVTPLDPHGEQFLISVARVLNKRNKNAVALLHGRHKGRTPKINNYTGTIESDLQIQREIDRISTMIEELFPSVSVSLIYRDFPVHQVVCKWEGLVDDLKGSDGLVASKIPFFEGILMKVRR